MSVVVYPWMDKSPFVQQWLEKGSACRETGRPWRIESVEDCIGEKMMYASLIEHGEIASEAPRAVAKAIREATPVLWEVELMQAATRIPMPKHTVAPDVMPHKALWFAFRSSLGLVSKFPDGGEVETQIEAALLTNQRGAVVVDGIGESRERAGSLKFGLLAEIKHRDVYPKAIERGAGNVFLSLLTFMQSPALTEVRTRKMDRAAQRRLPVELRDEAVSFVTLRRPAYHRKAGEGQEAEREFRVRWIVGGHMRAQWYPSLEAHRLIWIGPYVKGPEGAPLKPSAYRVVR